MRPTNKAIEHVVEDDNLTPDQKVEKVKSANDRMKDLIRAEYRRMKAGDEAAREDMFKRFIAGN